MARKPSPPLAPVAASFNEHVHRDESQAADTLAAVALPGSAGERRLVTDEELAEICELAGDVQAMNAFALMTKFSATAKIRMFMKVRESKRINDLPIRTTEGSLRRAKTIVEFCPLVFGQPYTTLVEAELSLNVLGEEAYETGTRLGLNRRELRAIRALPPASAALVRDAIVDGSTRQEVIAVIEDLAAALETERSKVADRDDEARKSTHKRELLEKQVSDMDSARRAYERLTPDEKLAKLQDEAEAATRAMVTYLRGGLRKACDDIQELSNPANRNNAYLAGLLKRIEDEVAELRADYNLPAPVVPDKKPWEKAADELRRQQQAERGGDAP